MLFYCYQVLAFFAAVQVVRSVVVSCPDGQYFCSCPVGETVCEFTLRIENRQAFTSFQLRPDGRMQNIGAPYVLNSTSGFRPAITGVGRACLFDDATISLVEDEDFTSRGCSPPLTVDGVSNSDLITVNGISPAPTLIVDSGATVYAHVVNDLMPQSETTSIHWHGMYQRHTPWMDGVGRITQPSIEPGTTFDYIFQASPIGTHWYHSHVGLQRTEGLYGALVVRGNSPPDSSELVPEENGNANIIDLPGLFTMTLIDWQMEDALDLFLMGRTIGFSPNMPAVQFLTGQGVTPIIRGVRIDGSDIGPTPFFSGLINGRGRRFENTATPLSILSVSGGTYYLFRVVGAMSRAAYMVSIDGHTLRVIATDGKNVEFKDVDFISVETGERYDFLVNASEAAGNYWIRAESLQVNVPNGEEYSARAILSYEGAESLDWRNGYSNVPESRRTCTTLNQCRVLNCAFPNFPSSENKICVSLLDLIPRPRKPQTELPRFPPSLDCPDCMYFLNFALEATVADDAHSVNAATFELPPKPYQTRCGQYDRDNRNESAVNTCEKNCPDPPEGGCECINVIPLANQAVFIDDKSSELESIVLVFTGFSFETTHPIHVHGHAFQVVYIGYGTYNEDGSLNSSTTDIICEDEIPPCTDPRWANGVPQGVMDRIVDGRVTNDAIQKDTVVLPNGGYVVIAFNADNPGYWYIHCHIESHTAGGMIALLQEYPPDQQWLPPPGINIPGDFAWSIDEYNDHIDAALMCSDERTSSDDFTISKAGFGITLAILILLAIICVILAVLLIILCVKAKTPENSSEKFGMK